MANFIWQLVILIFLLTGCTEHSEKKTYKEDIDFIFQTVMDHHPGPKNIEDPDFLKNVIINYQKAKQQGTKEDLISFVKSFSDSHVFLEFKNSKEKTNKDTKNLDIFEIDPKKICFKIETFDFNKQNKKQFEKMLKKAKKIWNYSTLVFDLRSNMGGNSDFAHDLNDAIFGKNYAHQKRCIAQSKQYVDWRASSQNIDHLEDLYKKYKSKWIKEIVLSLKTSLKKRENFYREYSNHVYLKNNIKSYNTNKKIIIIIDRSNVSAALDFIDDIKLQAKHITLIGEKTKADRLYMEIRGVDLPSGIANFYFPIKVYRNRLRGDNVPYTPDIVKDNVQSIKIEELTKNEND